MNQDTLQKWLDGLGDAWITRNPDAAANLCTENVAYYEDPFQPPSRGRAAVRQIWAEVPESQKDVQFKHDIISVTDEIGVAHWFASFTRLPSGDHAELDGIFVVSLDENGLCKEFHQWWNSKSS